jgi:hypothetical protein
MGKIKAEILIVSPKHRGGWCASGALGCTSERETHAENHHQKATLTSALAPSGGNEDNQQGSGTGDEERRPDRRKTKTRQRQTEWCWLAKHFNGEMRTRPRTTPGERTGQLKKTNSCRANCSRTALYLLVENQSWPAFTGPAGKLTDHRPVLMRAETWRSTGAGNRRPGKRKTLRRRTDQRRGDDFCGRNQNGDGSCDRGGAQLARGNLWRDWIRTTSPTHRRLKFGTKKTGGGKNRNGNN